MTDKQLYELIDNDGFDPEAGEDLPEEYELNEKLMKGNKEAKKLVIDTYNNIDFLYGKFITNYTRIFCWPAVMIYISICVFAGIGIWVSIMWNKFFFPPFIMVAVLIASLVAVMRRQILKLYFFKAKENKTVTVYKSKYYLVINCDRQLYRFFNNKWKKLNRWNHNLGTRLLFSKMVGKLSIEKKKDRMTIYGYKGCSNMKFKKGVLTSIFHIKVILTGPFRNQKCGSPQLIKDIEINTNRYVEIPKSFIDFCKEQGIDPPEECEYLHYA